jgi:hypothetical protein
MAKWGLQSMNHPILQSPFANFIVSGRDRLQLLAAICFMVNHRKPMQFYNVFMTDIQTVVNKIVVKKKP